MMKPGTERDYRRRIARVVEAILLEPGAPHALESLAAVAHLSPFHFHRIYRALTGERVVETVQRLRLEQAAQRLTDAAASVTTVAHDAGYNSPQAFARALTGTRQWISAWASACAIPRRRTASAIARPSSSRGRTPSLACDAVEPLRLDGGLYAVHGLIGPYALISPTFRALYGGWLPQSGYARDRRPALELYRDPLVAGLQQTCVTDLMTPIRKD